VEQLNIEGKHTGEGFVAHKAMLVNALSRAITDRVILNVLWGERACSTTLGLWGVLTSSRLSPQTVVPAGCELPIRGLRCCTELIPAT